MRRLWFLVLFSILFVASGCQSRGYASGGHTHNQGHSHAESSEHAHGKQGESYSETKTAWGDQFQLFIEFEPLAVGHSSHLKAYVSNLDGNSPARGGEFALILTGPEHPRERFEAPHSHKPGIFELTIKPEHQGKRNLLGLYKNDSGTHRFNLGTLALDEHPDDTGHGAHSEAIEFTKKQQWTVEFSTDLAQKRRLRETVPAQGFVRAGSDGDVSVKAPFSGRLLRARSQIPDVGTRVRDGETIAVIAPTIDANVLPTLRADLTEAKTELQSQRREVRRLETLVEQNAVPKKELLDARSTLKSVEARVEAASNRLDQYQGFQTGSGVGALTLKAPIDGKVVGRSVTSGEYLEAGNNILRIVDTNRKRLEAKIAEANMPKTESIQGATLRYDEETLELGDKDGAFLGFLDYIDPNTRTASAWFRLPPKTGLSIGAYQRIQVRTGDARQVISIPTSAVLERKGLSMVYVVKDGERFERRVVQTGINDGDWVEIKRGLEPGNRVVSKGAYYVMLAASTSGTVGSHSH